MVPPAAEAIVPSDDHPTLPQKGYSGSAIKIRVVRAMQTLLTTEKACFAALDHLNDLLSQSQSYPPPPPRPNGRYRDGLESTA